MTLDDVKMVNCARCDAELLGESMALLEGESVPLDFFQQERVELPPLLTGRIRGRPYCRSCHISVSRHGVEPSLTSMMGHVEIPVRAKRQRRRT